MSKRFEWARGVLPVVLAAGVVTACQTVQTTLFPITLASRRLGVRLQPPRKGEHTRALLAGLGMAGPEIDRLVAQGVIA